MYPSDDMPLNEVQKWVQDNLKEGVICPCCDRYARLYHRKLNRGMAVSLIRMYREAGLEWQIVHSTKWREESKLKHWGLIAAGGDERGMWRVTAKGAAFVRGRIRLPSHIDEFDGRCIRLCDERMVSVSDVLQSPFDYDELMRDSKGDQSE